jgi:hypothetical protein
MSIALENQPQNPAKEMHKINSEGCSPALRCGPADGLNRLTELLVSAPIDLAGISDEIRRHPDLQSLVLRLGVSLVLSPEEPLSTVEEAVVVLGTNRLRVLIDLWSSGDALAPQAILPQNAASSERGSVATTPEMRYLLGFLRSVGFDSPEKAFSGSRLASWASKIPPDQMFALTDLFMRDFFSLLPVIQPDVREAAQSSRP